MDSLKLNPRTSGASFSCRATRLRLHRYLALCGLGSRRACERLIESGRVSVDHEVVRRQGLSIDPAVHTIQVDGKLIHTEKKVYLVINKPRDIVCTSSDPQGRRTFKVLLPPSLAARVYTVGRLDRNSEGLLVVTNDGDLANALMHPRYHVEKVYQVWTDRPLTPNQERRLNQGVRSEGEMLVLDSFRSLRVNEIARCGVQNHPGVYRVRLREGRNRHIRRMFEAIGVRIVRLKRLAVGPLTLGGLRSGAWRYLEEREIQELWDDIHERSTESRNKGIQKSAASSRDCGIRGHLSRRSGTT